MNTRVVLVAIGLAGYALFGTSANDLVRPVTVQEATHVEPIAQTPASTTRSLATLPTVIAPPETTPPRAGYAAASLPALDSTLDPVVRIASLPTVTPPLARDEPERPGCDPAYPDPDTCIPPGPPFAQGCAVTAERRFSVLPPDPQALDHDGDGIGCEPIARGT